MTIGTLKQLISKYDPETNNNVQEVLDLAKSLDVEIEHGQGFESPGYDSGSIFFAWINNEGKIETEVLNWEEM